MKLLALFTGRPTSTATEAPATTKDKDNYYSLLHSLVIVESDDLDRSDYYVESDVIPRIEGLGKKLRLKQRKVKKAIADNLRKRYQKILEAQLEIIADSGIPESRLAESKANVFKFGAKLGLSQRELQQMIQDKRNTRKAYVSFASGLEF